MGFKTISAAILAAIVAAGEPEHFAVFEKNYMETESACKNEMKDVMNSAPKRLQEAAMEYFMSMTPLMDAAGKGIMFSKNLR